MPDSLTGIKPRFKLIGALVIFTLLAFITNVIVFVLKQRPTTARSRAGGVITLESYAFKKGNVKHDLRSRPSARAAARLLPEAITKNMQWLRPQRTIFATAPFPNELFLSVVFSSQGGPGKADRVGTRVVIADDRGQSFDGVLNYMANGGVFEINAFPRRGKELRLQLMEDEKALAEFRIPNPARGAHPVWEPRPLPMSVKNGGLDVTLESFTTDIKARKTRCVFHVREHGQESTTWLPASFELWDATGNHWRPSRSSPIQESNGRVRASFLGALWPDEHAWRMRVEFKSNPPSNQTTSAVEFVVRPEFVRDESLPH